MIESVVCQIGGARYPTLRKELERLTEKCDCSICVKKWPRKNPHGLKGVARDKQENLRKQGVKRTKQGDTFKSGTNIIPGGGGGGGGWVVGVFRKGKVRTR